MHWNELVGFAAALAVLASFCMSSIISLRSVALLSNVLFITYGALGHIHPVLFLHAALLPINLIKLHRIVWLRQPDSATKTPTISGRGNIKHLHQTMENIHSLPS